MKLVMLGLPHAGRVLLSVEVSSNPDQFPPVQRKHVTVQSEAVRIFQNTIFLSGLLHGTGRRVRAPNLSDKINITGLCGETPAWKRSQALRGESRKCALSKQTRRDQRAEGRDSRSEYRGFNPLGTFQKQICPCIIIVKSIFSVQIIDQQSLYFQGSTIM